MRILDLFCGAGGFALGFLLASPQFKISLAIDNDFRAMQTYTSNINVDVNFVRDIQNIHSIEILECMNHCSPDIILASPPCESFSAANFNRKKTAYDRLYADENGRFILDAIRLIIDLEPSVFIIENVTQIGTEEMQNLIRHEFSRSSYNLIHFNILESTSYGVPSFRKRVFISNLEFTSPDNLILKTVGDVFESLPEPNIEINNHEAIPIPPKMSKKAYKTPPGEALVFFRGAHGKTFRNYIRLQINEPSPTVMGKSRFIHPTSPRLCTVREHARLMSYPDSFQFFGPKNWQYNQVGESVPPLLSKAIAKEIISKFPEK